MVARSTNITHHIHMSEINLAQQVGRQFGTYIGLDKTPSYSSISPFVLSWFMIKYFDTQYKPRVMINSIGTHHAPHPLASASTSLILLSTPRLRLLCKGLFPLWDPILSHRIYTNRKTIIISYMTGQVMLLLVVQLINYYLFINPLNLSSNFLNSYYGNQVVCFLLRWS